MAWTGSSPNQTTQRNTGVYTGTTAWAQTDSAARGIRADDHDTHDQDLADMINLCLKKDGGNKPTGDIDWGTYGITNLGELSSATEASVASATTTNVLGQDAIFVSVTGTTTITSLGTGTKTLKIVRFTGALTLTHNATSLILPGGANITTAAGDTMIVVSDASSNARVVSYQRAAVVPYASTPAFSANKNGSDQTISSSSATKVSFGTEAFDNGSYFDAATNYRWTPPAGIVHISAKAYIASISAGDDINLLLYKNGSLHKYLMAGESINGAVHLGGSTVESVNGTDYFEIYIDSSSDTSYSVEGDANLTWFCGSAL